MQEYAELNWIQLPDEIESTNYGLIKRMNILSCKDNPFGEYRIENTLIVDKYATISKGICILFNNIAQQANIENLVIAKQLVKSWHNNNYNLIYNAMYQLMHKDEQIEKE